MTGRRVASAAVRGRRLIPFAAALAFALTLSCAHAVTRGLTRHYAIPAGQLDDTLRALAARGNVQLLYAPQLTAGQRAVALEGDFTPADALAIVLRGSGLQAEVVTPDTYVLRRIAPAAAAPATRAAGRALPPAPLESLPVPLLAVEVTGTHLRRTAMETASPLTVIDRRQIEHSGYQTLFELLRAQPGVRVNNAPVALSDSALYQANGLSGATGAAAVDLHGLGATATLFLVDGQRMAGYGLSQGEFSLVNDLESIPLALVERIEVLRDGASAIYGSDAMAGVVNIILRKQFQGVALDGNAGISSRGDASQRRVTGSFGSAFGHGGHLLLSADYLERSPLLGRDRRWARNGGDGGDGTYYFDGGQIGYDNTDGGCTRLTLDGPCTNTTGPATTLQTQLDSRSLLLHVDHPVGSLEAYAGLRWNSVRQHQQTGPATEQLLLFDPGPPRSVRVVNYAFADIGPIRDATQSRSTQLSAGLRGHPGDWQWDLRLDDQHNAGTDRVRGLLRSSVLDQALSDGSYQPGGRNSPAVLAALSPQLLRTGHTSQSGFSLRADGPLAQWPLGELGLAAGIEGYREQLDDQPDPLLIANDVFQFQPPYVRRGDRWISAAYVEMEAPLAKGFTANVAARADHSGGFGWAFSPRLGLKWDVSDEVSFRGTLARGYRAPTLPELDRPQALLPTGVRVEVPSALLPCVNGRPVGGGYALCTLRLDSVSNPELRPERSRSLTFGVVLAPTPALGIALDVYQVDRRHEIRALPVSYALDHPDAFPELFRRDAQGALYAFDQQLVNLGKTMVRSFDLDVRYRLDTRRLGSFSFNLGVDWLSKLRRQIVPDAPPEPYDGYADQPKATALGSVEWSRGDWVTTANLRYTGHYGYRASANSRLTCPDGLREAGHCSTPAFTQLDLNLDYSGFDHWRIGLNVHNALDHAPRYYGPSSLAYSPAFDDVVGRYFLLSFHYQR
ncbi:TonB-dependent receptor [Dyella sp.]|jgi:outer membrane receptor protein involved in Fe transport|uniref:TonB-dependent receptor n=1 Tax=Dyella sp. TaxID=1869338 RepID=UPI002D77E7A5|nr:TonB-dependent receptor [Dyella sp.]HET6431550.1 TonB-dependent receptor [Dyella sp.]